MSEKKSGCGCLLLIVILMTVGYSCFAYYDAADQPINWPTVAKVYGWTLAICFGVRILWALIIHRRKKPQPRIPDLVVEVQSPNVAYGDLGDLSATPRQLEFIRILGGNPREDMSMAEASAMIDELKIERDIHNREEARHRFKQRKENKEKEL